MAPVVVIEGREEEEEEMIARPEEEAWLQELRKGLLTMEDITEPVARNEPRIISEMFRLVCSRLCSQSLPVSGTRDSKNFHTICSSCVQARRNITQTVSRGTSTNQTNAIHRRESIK